MKRLLIVCCITITGLAQAQKSEIRNVTAFKGVKVQEGIDVYLKKGAKESLRIEVTGVNTTDVLTQISGNYLKIELRNDDDFPRDRTVKVYVTYVEIDKLAASSAASIFSENTIKANQFSIDASSAATIDIQVDTEGVEVHASSAAQVELKGKAKAIDIEVSSAGIVDAYELASDKAIVNASSAGVAKVNALKEIDAHASSGGSVRYRGNPERSNTNSSSGGSVKKSN